MNFAGFQVEIKELNGLSGGGTTNPQLYSNLVGFPTNTQLDANFSTLAAQYPALGLTTGQFVANDYSGLANANGPQTLQEIGVTQYPYAPSVTAVPEPASIVLLSLGALGAGFYARRQRKSVPV
jgi:hypothetical protein